MDNIYSGTERRKVRRIKANFMITYTVDRPLEIVIKINRKNVSALMLELTSVGMSFETFYDIPESSTLLIHFTLINPSLEDKENRIREIDVVGEVRDSIPMGKNEHRIGVSFSKISDEHKSIINEFTGSMS